MTRFDPALVQRGARLRRSPYFEATQRAGCRGYTVYNHMLLPICRLRSSSTLGSSSNFGFGSSSNFGLSVTHLPLS